MNMARVHHLRARAEKRMVLLTHTKIAFLGAGSHRFARELLIDCCLTPGLADSEIVLVDPDEARLQAVLTFARRYASELGVPLRFLAHTDRTHALPEADFVICSALAGGRAATEADRALLENFGYYRGIGLNTSFRQLQLMLDIARDMAELCPSALFIQAANPVPETCQLIDAETGVETVGICHGHLSIARVAALLGLDPGMLESTVVGINHCIWALRLQTEGRDVYPLLEEWAREVGSAFYQTWLKRGRNDDYPIAPIAFDLFRLYGLWPVGDSCRAITPETWWYHCSAQTKEQWYGPTGGLDGARGTANNLTWLRSQGDDLAEVAGGEGMVTAAYPPQHSAWQIVPILDSRLNNRPSTQQVSIKNTGPILAGLPEYCFVEVPARVDASGFHASEQYHLPESVLLGVLLPRVLLCDRIVAAHRTGDCRFLLQAWLADHKTTSYEQARSALTALITAPGNEAMLAHYRHSLALLATGSAPAAQTMPRAASPLAVS
jgi:alpha-galactosidase